eukprot:12256434-Ditylum_brightwellii.AAC.1
MRLMLSRRGQESSLSQQDAGFDAFFASVSSSFLPSSPFSAATLLNRSSCMTKSSALLAVAMAPAFHTKSNTFSALSGSNGPSSACATASET